MPTENRDNLRAIAVRARDNQHDGEALNDYGMAMAPAVTIALLDEIDRLTGFVVRRREQADEYNGALDQLSSQRDRAFDAMRDASGKLIQMAAHLIGPPLGALHDLQDEDKRMTRPRVDSAVDFADARLKDAAYELRKIADALTALNPPLKTPPTVACRIAFREGVKEPEILSWNQLPVGEYNMYGVPPIQNDQGDQVAWMVKVDGMTLYRPNPSDSARAQNIPLYTHAEPAEVGQLRKEAELTKSLLLSASVTLGEICEALGIDDHSEPDMIVEAAKSVREGLDRIVAECPLGTPGFAIACEVLGELGVQQEPCDHQFTDDGEFLLVCTECGHTEDHDPKWRPIETAPTDGTLVRLLVEFEPGYASPEEQTATIGFNNEDNTGVDAWSFAGWSTQAGLWCEGKGEVNGWLPLLDPSVTTSKS